MSPELSVGEHISSVIIRFGQGARCAVIDRVAEIRGVEIVYADETTAIGIIQTVGGNTAGETLAGITATDGVLSAVLAYEQSVSGEVEVEGEGE